MFLAALLLLLLGTSHAEDPAFKARALHTPEGCKDKRLSKVGDLMLIHFNSSFKNGTLIETSRVEGRTAFTFHLGAIETYLDDEGESKEADITKKDLPMRSWQEGLVQMCEGNLEIRKHSCNSNRLRLQAKFASSWCPLDTDTFMISQMKWWSSKLS